MVQLLYSSVQWVVFTMSDDEKGKGQSNKLNLDIIHNQTDCFMSSLKSGYTNNLIGQLVLYICFGLKFYRLFTFCWPKRHFEHTLHANS